ncbi:MAG: hypothetical protein NT051_06530 [Candidatus Micrarchaeota archaeon]|nr:hypothetical protein [Candidatus Micrarchaeota archaeon]
MSELRTYPVARPTTAPATGSILYKHLMENLKIPASASHKIWFAGEAEKLAKPDLYSFRGKAENRKKIELVALNGNAINKDSKPEIITLNGSETVLVSDLSEKSKAELKMPENARGKDKVFNPNFVEYEQLGEYTKASNELAAIAFVKGFSSYYGGETGKTLYSEMDVLNFINVCFTDLSSKEMLYVMNNNHMAWTTLAYMREKGASGDMMVEFFAQNPHDFYNKDLGTILPSMFYTLALLNQNPVAYYEKLDVDVWGAREAATYMIQYMAGQQK